MTMRQVADAVGISNPYLSQIERGLREPSERVMEAIVSALELSAETVNQYSGRAADSDDGPSEVETAIESDPYLRPRQRQALLEVYRSFAGRPGRRTG
jgi:transcriptional regulator with XRE-family HTH domain